jgi:hypothetical protein
MYLLCQHRLSTICLLHILSYFGHVMRRGDDNLEKLVVDGGVGKRARGRSPTIYFVFVYMFQSGFLNRYIVIEVEVLYAYKMHNIVEKHFSISIAPVRSQGASLLQGIKITKDVAVRAKKSLELLTRCYFHYIIHTYIPTRTGPAWWVMARFPYVCNP